MEMQTMPKFRQSMTYLSPETEMSLVPSRVNFSPVTSSKRKNELNKVTRPLAAIRWSDIVSDHSFQELRSQ